MHINKLEVGLVFKNYKDMCNILGLKVKSGTNGKNHQLKHIEQYCNLEKDGHKIIVKEVYETPIPKIDMRGKNPNSRNRVKPIYINNPKLASQWLVEENGMEIPSTLTRTSNEEYWWQCPDCNHKIFSSPAKRFNKSKAYTDDFITCPYCYLSKGAKVIYDFLEVNNISFKQEYMFNDLVGLGGKKLRFDFALFNNDQEMISLIEFDGGYHDKDLNPDIEKYKVVSAHDNLKDQYCVKNNISFLRIHHSDSDNILTILSNFLLNSHITQEIKDSISNEYKKNIVETIIAYEIKKTSLQNELLKIDHALSELKSLL